MSTFLLREKVLRPEGAEYGVAIFRSAMKKNMFFFCIFSIILYFCTMKLNFKVLSSKV